MSLVLLISQSNGLTFGNIGPAPYTPTARVQIWLPEAQTFAPMTPGLNTGSPIHPTAWGPEVSFANAWLEANPSGTLYLGKVSKGSTPIADWLPSTDLFDQALLTANRMKFVLDRPLDQVLMIHGETDAMALETALAYGDNLAVLKAAFRAGLAQHDLPFITSLINPTTPYADELRLEQHLQALADPHSTSFDTSHLSTYDGLHLDPPSVIALGELFFDNLF